MAKKKPTVSKLHKKLWPLFSKFIRLRDSEGKEGANCFTCKKWYEIKLLQAGHFLSRRHKATLYEEKNVHAQCYNCNINLKGNPAKYFVEMEKKYGRPLVDRLMKQSNEIKQFKPYELEEMIERYKNLIK